MKAFLVFAILASAAFAAITFPERYYLEGTLTLPYANISEPVALHYDGVENRGRISFYNDLDWFLYRLDTSDVYEILVWKDHQVCVPSKSTEEDELVSLLPDMSLFTLIGKTTLKNVPVDHYQYVIKHDAKVNTYDMYVTYDAAKNPIPVRYRMGGYNLVLYSHYDEYIIDYGLYLPNVVSEDAYAIPKLCDSVEHTISRPAGAHSRGFAQLSAMFPSSPAAAKTKLTLDANLAYIAAHNAQPSKAFSMQANKFSHMSYDDFSKLYLTKHKKSNVTMSENVRLFKRGDSGLPSIPDAVDWRKVGAVTKVKDQAVCGSCWAYGTTGAMEGAYWMKYRKSISFSEQELVDCSWTDRISDFDLNGCDGGIQERAFEWIMANGGLSYEFSYPYIMQDDYCAYRSTPIKAAKISGYRMVTSGDELALKEAVAAYGPVTVGIDVPMSMVYYGDGVYADSQCHNDAEHLVHAVLVVGYGTTSSGQDYWIVKNSWSTYWGADGYILFARNKGNMCGIASEASFVPYTMIERVNNML